MENRPDLTGRVGQHKVALKKKKSKTTLIELVRSQEHIWPAWQAIRENGKSSISIDTQNDIRRFDEGAMTELQSIMGRLSSGTFKFEKAKGVEKKRGVGKSDRPIVMATIGNRIVQRSILDVLQNQSNLQDLVSSELSFGGIQKRGVRQAVETAQQKIKLHKSAYYICSDISGFFTAIRRDEVVKAVGNIVREASFADLFDRALQTELENMANIRNVSLFPLHDIGVAQGCCLSPLVGNIYLREFDRALNSEDVFCLRYIDDFLLIGPDEKTVRLKFQKALKILKDLGLSAYDPDKDREKAHQGYASKGFDYLGCHILPNEIRPSTKGFKRLRDSVNASFQPLLQLAVQDEIYKSKRLNLANIASANSRRIEGWIKQYGFCSNEKVIGQWGAALNQDFLDFENHFSKLIRSRNRNERSRLIGLCDMAAAFDEQRQKIERKKASS